MKEYDIKITETLEKTVTVKAESMEAAQAKVEEEYYNSEHILDSENFTGVDFSAEAEREIVQEQKEQLDVLLVKPGMYPQAVQIGGELEDLQKAVGGDIEAVYQEYIQRRYNAFCKTVIRCAALDKILKLKRQWERQVSLDYLMNEKFASPL